MPNNKELATRESDLALVRQAKAGNNAALTSLLEGYQPLLESYLGRLLDDEPIAIDDVLQEVYMRVLHHINELREEQRFGAWLKSIAWRESRAWVHKAQREAKLARPDTELAENLCFDEAQPAHPPAWLQRIADAMDDMNEGTRYTLALFYVRGLSYQRIADFLDLPLGTVKRRLSTARVRIRDAAGEKADEETRERTASTVHTLLEHTLQSSALTQELPPMKIALFSSVYGNIFAFKAILEDIDSCRIENIYNLGDTIGYNADPKAVLDLMRERNIPSLRGNHDHGLLEDDYLEKFNNFASRAIYYCRGALNNDDRNWLRELPTERIEHGMHMTHATPAGEHFHGYVLNDQAIKDAFEAAKTDLIIISNTNTPSITWEENGEYIHQREGTYTIKPGQQTLVNVGGVGQPRDGDKRATWVLYDTDSQTLEIRRIDYDCEAAKARIDEAGLPSKLGERLLIGR